MAKRGQNEGSIFQRKDGRWVALLNLGWVDGKRARKSYYGETRREVQERLTKALCDIQRACQWSVKSKRWAPIWAGG
jgi:integrase